MTKLFDSVNPDMEVVASDGSHVGTVDHEEGQDRIKLKKHDGDHRYLSWDWVDRVNEGKLVLKVSKAQLRKAWDANPDAHIR
jgi:hypothetical protein